MKKLKVLELFAGTRCIGQAFEEKGYEVFSVEWDTKHKNIDLYTDIGHLTADVILEKFGRPDIIWASPDCTTYSVAAISHHETAPRGSKSGTQRLKGKIVRSLIPKELCEHIVSISEEVE